MDRKDGIYVGISRSDYEAIPAINCSILKHFRRSAAHAREYMIHPQEPTAAMDFGTAFHCSVLEPEKFKNEYVVAPKIDRRTKVGKEEWANFEAENRGKELIDADDMELLLGMAKSCREDQFVSSLLSSPGKNEVGVVWTDPDTKMRCKCLIDRITSWAGWTVVIDFKTTDNATPSIFSLSVAKYGYHEQAAYYLEGLKRFSDIPRRWIFVAVEKKRPFSLACYELPEAELELGKALWQSHLKQYAECLKTNIWPAYPAGLHPIRLPKWEFIEAEE